MARGYNQGAFSSKSGRRSFLVTRGRRFWVRVVVITPKQLFHRDQVKLDLLHSLIGQGESLPFWNCFTNQWFFPKSSILNCFIDGSGRTPSLGVTALSQRDCHFTHTGWCVKTHFTFLWDACSYMTVSRWGGVFVSLWFWFSLFGSHKRK